MSDYHKSHGIIMGVVVALLFPLGAMFMRLGGNAWVHGAIQIFSLAALIAGFGIGVKLAQMSDEVCFPHLSICRRGVLALLSNKR